MKGSRAAPALSALLDLDVEDALSLPHGALSERVRFSTQENRRIVHTLVLLRESLDLFDGNARDSVCWLNTPAVALGGPSPLERLRAQGGLQAIRDLIGRLRTGVIT